MEIRENKTNGNERYNAQGYKDRDEYLTSLAQDFGIDMMAVRVISDILGPSEDFDGLINETEIMKWPSLGISAFQNSGPSRR